MSNVDFGKRSGDYAEHRPGFPESFYVRLQSFIALDGARVLDVGTGPGIIALELANRGATVVGLDIAESQIKAARERAAAAGLAERCQFDVGGVERMNFDTESFDLVTAGQCWHWFDKGAAIPELHRVLRPGGLLVVAHYSYLALHSELAKATEDLILQFNPTWTMAGSSGLYADHIDTLVLGGFELVEQFCYDHDRMFTHAGWRGRMRTCNGVGSGNLSEDRVAEFDDALAELLTQRFPDEPVPVRHRVWAIIVRRP